MAKHILSVSFHAELLVTRHMLLEGQGYKVTSALGRAEALARCKDGKFDLFVLGHSIPDGDKNALVRAFRKINGTPVLSLRLQEEMPVVKTDYEVSVDDPSEFLKTVAEILEKPRSATQKPSNRDTKSRPRINRRFL